MRKSLSQTRRGEEGGCGSTTRRGEGEPFCLERFPPATTGEKGYRHVSALTSLRWCQSPFSLPCNQIAASLRSSQRRGEGKPGETFLGRRLSPRPFPASLPDVRAGLRQELLGLTRHKIGDNF